MSIFIPTLWFFLFQTHAEGDWKLAKKEDDIEVFTREVSDSKYLAFKASMIVEASANEILNILENVEAYPEWFAFTASCRLLNKKGDTKTIYMEIDYPWPYSNECMYYEIHVAPKSNHLQEVSIRGLEGKSDCKYSLKKASGYLQLESKKGSTMVTYYMHSEPSQNIPSWLINPLIHEMPFKTLQGLRQKLSL